MSKTFTVDTRGVFTVHKAGCFHLRGAAHQFDVVSEPNRAAILVELDEFADGGDVEEVITFGPCLRDLP